MQHLASFTFFGLPALLYWAQAANYWFGLGRPGMALAMVAYGIANGGLFWDVLQQAQPLKGLCT